MSNKKFVAIIDYEMGNTGSVKNALDYLRTESVISCDPKIIAESTHLILPGVGAFGEGMKTLNKKGLIKVLNKEVISRKKPFLGICLGMQLLAEFGEEDGNHKGLGWIEGKARKFKIDEKEFRLPHIGWNDISPTDSSGLFKDAEPFIFYFVHSYILEPKNSKVIIGECDYGEKFTAAVNQENIFGVQFHPERSQKSGIKLLENFIQLN